VVQQQLLKCHECSKVYRKYLVNNKFIFCYEGLGWATLINSFLVSIYYNVIIGWCLFYFFASFRRKLQWSDCGNWWNTDRCANPGHITFFLNNRKKSSLMFL
jgi:SNF family Na+-dependent transporter